MSHSMETPISRRTLFSEAGRLSVAAALVGGFIKIPEAHADINDEIKKAMGSSDVDYNQVTIDAPIIAENGKVVPLKISVDHPMDANNYIESIALIIDNNPTPLIATFTLTPKNGKAQVATRVKMGKTSNVRAIARTNTGKLLGAISEVKVTIGGCGG
ncbi:MAG: thiosulfate oxidation carrier protein SoxY [Magnetococcales bacterium]|nr:thiosulfate oxidation carrier protein SoxY [Magnetococcales bacterium]